jgi:hypothetical protein
VIDIRQVAQTYIDAGWAVVPLVKGEKHASSSWQKKTYRAADFKPSDGIGGKCGEPSGGRVDLDCDAPEAVEAARLLVPDTGLMHGRPGKPTSHYWFICPDLKTIQFTDIKDANKTQMLVELRSTGGYTALPPSGHPSGDVLAWEREGDPMTVAPEDLREVATNIALTALILRHWGELDHTSMGHLAGFWLHGGMNPNRLLRLFKTIGTLASGNVGDEILAFANTTINKHIAGERVTGAPKLTEYLGPVAVAKMRRWLNFTDTDAFDELNAIHFFTTVGVTSVIGREDKLQGDSGEVVFQRPKELGIEYANRKTCVGEDKRGNAIIKALFAQWLESRERRDYRSVVFAPPPLVCDPRDYNLYRDFIVTPSRSAASTAHMRAFLRGDYVPGQCFRMLHHLHHVIADCDSAYFRVIVDWLAAMVQRPGDVAGSAHVWVGEEGTGKNLAIGYIARLFHPSMTFSGASDLVVGKFNAVARNKIFFNINESDGRMLRRNFDRVKMIITEPLIYVEPKGIDAFPIRNFAHVIFTTNPDEQGNVHLPAHVGQRRMVIQRVSNRYAEGRCAPIARRAYFDALVAEMNDPSSLGAFLCFLQNRDLSNYDPFEKLTTAEEVRQRSMNLNSPMRWLFEVAELGTFRPRVLSSPTLNSGWPTEEVPSHELYAAYVESARLHLEKVWEAPQWGKAVSSFLWEDGKTKPTHRDGDGVRVGRVVSLAELKRRLPSFDSYDGETIGIITRTPNGPLREVPVKLANDEELPEVIGTTLRSLNRRE